MLRLGGSSRNCWALSLRVFHSNLLWIKLQKLSKRVTFTGTVNNTEDFYKNADIFVSPSEFGEGMQGTILEAMSCGLTVVATNSKANTMLLENNRGFLIEPTIDCVCIGIENAIKSNRECIGIQAHNYVERYFNWLKKTKDIEKEILN